jgi:hypothetical protein
MGPTGSADQRIRGGWRTHGGAEVRREQREEPTTGPGGQLACPVLLPVMLERPWLAPREREHFVHIRFASTGTSTPPPPPFFLCCFLQMLGVGRPWSVVVQARCRPETPCAAQPLKAPRGPCGPISYTPNAMHCIAFHTRCTAGRSGCGCTQRGVYGPLPVTQKPAIQHRLAVPAANSGPGTRPSRLQPPTGHGGYPVSIARRLKHPSLPATA